MQLGIVGFPKTGKTTLFNLLTASRETTDKFSKSSEAHLAICLVPDDRLKSLSALYKPKKETPATVQFVDIPGVTKQVGSADLNLNQLKDVDALVHVVRAFDDQEIPHPEGSVNGTRDLASLDLELIFADLELGEASRSVLLVNSVGQDVIVIGVISAVLLAASTVSFSRME